MGQQNNLGYDKTDPISIFEYAIPLIGKTLRQVVGDEVIHDYHSDPNNKGGLGQMVEELYYHYKPNSSPEPDFAEAGVELKVTGLKQLKDLTLQIKERLVVDMINYVDVIKEPFEMSTFYRKFKLLLLIFYLYERGIKQFDRFFIYVALWKIPEKDLLIIKHDYQVIIDKIKRGEAHLLSEGDTEYLGACRKGQKDDPLCKQPNSEIGALKRAFSLKPAYMRTVLEYIKKSGKPAVVNFEYRIRDNQLVSAKELEHKSFEDIILDKFSSFIGMSYEQLCTAIGCRYDSSKDKYALLANRIVLGKPGKVNQSEEFKKAGLQLKTIRVQENGNIREAMSFENINYYEVLETEHWEDSRLYEIFSGRFLFVVFRANGQKIRYYDERRNAFFEEDSYSLDNVFFWTMPTQDLELAKFYWCGIKKAIQEDHIAPEFFPKNERFHVRPKGVNARDLTENPNGGLAKKYCYWFNNNYVTEIVRNNGTK